MNEFYSTLQPLLLRPISVYSFASLPLFFLAKHYLLFLSSLTLKVGLNTDPLSLIHYWPTGQMSQRSASMGSAEHFASSALRVLHEGLPSSKATPPHLGEGLEEPSSREKTFSKLIPRDFSP